MPRVYHVNTCATESCCLFTSIFFCVHTLICIPEILGKFHSFLLIKGHSVKFRSFNHAWKKALSGSVEVFSF